MLYGKIFVKIHFMRRTFIEIFSDPQINYNNDYSIKNNRDSFALICTKLNVNNV